MEDLPIQVGIVYTDEQIQLLARPAVALADAARLREKWKHEFAQERSRGDVRTREHYMTKESYREAKRKYRDALAKYLEVREGV